MNTLDVFSWIALAPTFFVFAIFINEVAFGLAPLGQAGMAGKEPAATTILIPAHNEAKGIRRTLMALQQRIPNGTKILVVADNCDDATAREARESGVEVIERHDAERRGKGFALDYGRAHMSTFPPDCVIILDADCLPEPGSIGALSAATMHFGRPVQSVNLMKAGQDAGPMVQISNFAFLVKNLVRQRGLARSGGPAMLTGTGMAFPWPIFEKLELASSNIVEDLAITVDLTRSGAKPMLVEGARVWSDAATAADTLTQRTRWEHGFIGTAARHALPALIAGITQRQLASLRLGLHLLVPPLAMLFVVGSGVLALLSVAAMLGGSTAPALTLVLMMTSSLLLLAIAWWRDGRALLSARAIMRIPLYVVWKIPVYLKLFRGAESEWIRTNRQD